MERLRNFFLVVLFISIPLSVAGDDFAVLGLYLTSLSLFYARREKWHNFLILIGFITYFAGFLLGLVFTDNLSDHYNLLRSFWRMGLPFALFYSLKDIRFYRYINLLVFFTILIGIYALIQFFTGLDILRSHKLQSEYHSLYGVWFALGAFSHHLTFGGVMLVIFSLIAPLAFCRSFQVKLRLYYLLGALTGFLSLIATMGRSNWLGAMASCFTIYLFLVGRKIALISVILVLIAGGALIMSQSKLSDKPLMDSPIFNRIADGFSISHNYDRLMMWYAAIRIIKDSPVFGAGPGNAVKMRPYYQTIEKENKHLFQHDPGVGVHNIYLQTWVEYGLLGLIGFLSIWGIYFTQIILALLRNSRLSQSERLLLIGNFSGMIGICVAGLFENNFRDAEVQVAILTSVGITLVLIYGHLFHEKE